VADLMQYSNALVVKNKRFGILHRPLKPVLGPYEGCIRVRMMIEHLENVIAACP
jgi:hypothetical protein